MPHATFVVPIRCTNPDLSLLEQSSTKANAGTTTRRQRLCTRTDQSIPRTKLLRLPLNLRARSRDEEVDAWSDLAALHDVRSGDDVGETGVRAAEEVGLVDRYTLRFQYGDRVGDLYTVWSGYVWNEGGEVKDEVGGVLGVGVRC